MRALSKAQRHVHVPPGQGRRLRVLTDIVEIKLSGAETGGRYALVELRTPPLGGAAELHTHPPQETFIVLEGTFEHRGLGADGPYSLRTGPGDVVQIPAGAPHSYQNVGESEGRLLAILEPPGRMLEFFEVLHGAVDHPDPLHAPPAALPALDRVLEIFAAHDVLAVPIDATWIPRLP